jgi:hypothetical protein
VGWNGERLQVSGGCETEAMTVNAEEYRGLGV